MLIYEGQVHPIEGLAKVQTDTAIFMTKRAKQDEAHSGDWMV